MKLIEKGLASFICAIMLSIALAAVLSRPSTISFSFMFTVALFYSFPMLLIGGVTFAVLAEKLLTKWKPRKTNEIYPRALMIYAVGGVVVNYFFYVSLFRQEWGNVLFFLVIGVIASLFFYHVLLVISYAFRANLKES
ncbi:hypothetical protein [Halalkalibacter krulwichiae]|uniref:Uncharacterized protein n=1 Tax=Halalkalibacter krulwichiae TaxID=199441 RepID=A0A1X9MIN9_9BACI|nr:hypothetical protein [Halalkalibacter krulwichiae]ARK32664.1 hypothetical protein BkAM31D_23975 [Halalkalibacter krulwichiae]